MRGAGAKAGAGSASHACPRPTCGYHGGFHPVGTLSPRITPSPDRSPGCGVQPLTPQIQTCCPPGGTDGGDGAVGGLSRSYLS